MLRHLESSRVDFTRARCLALLVALATCGCGLLQAAGNDASAPSADASIIGNSADARAFLDDGAALDARDASMSSCSVDGGDVIIDDAGSVTLSCAHPLALAPLPVCVPGTWTGAVSCGSWEEGAGLFPTTCGAYRAVLPLGWNTDGPGMYLLYGDGEDCSGEQLVAYLEQETDFSWTCVAGPTLLNISSTCLGGSAGWGSEATLCFDAGADAAPLVCGAK